mmetsp:Transcript_13026/g.19171  ORF Transcript_13026/g.19171 Transcript_13026/m.19171 type:complete len:203 (-) Transcript_13026:4055-4663(-)
MHERGKMAENPAVVSGEEDHGQSHHKDSAEEEDDETLKFGNVEEPSNVDQLYCPDMDDTDEAWVHKNLRSDISKPVANKSALHDGTESQQREVLESEKTTDAVLSCPCCFTTVCMDCQRHVKYPNQFRAMFVMNITVNWESNLVYDPVVKRLVDEKKNTLQSPIREEQEVYYSVHCIQCQTQVAVLDMKEELYHFFECLSSS